MSSPARAFASSGFHQLLQPTSPSPVQPVTYLTVTLINPQTSTPECIALLSQIRSTPFDSIDTQNIGHDSVLLPFQPTNCLDPQSDHSELAMTFLHLTSVQTLDSGKISVHTA